jgi:hypothetical protein
MPNPNENCLEGMRCPNLDCGSYGPFQINAEASFTVTDDGTDDYEDVEWSDKSWCRCMECGNSATVDDFKKEKLAR